VRLDAYVDVCNPTGYSMHFADSPTCDGYGGDAGTANHNAEAHTAGTGIYIYGSDDTTRGGTEPGTARRNAIPSSGCYRVHWAIDEDDVSFEDFTGLSTAAQISLHSYETFEVPPYNEPDYEDTTSADAPYWYFGLNRTVGAAYRTGTGVGRACLVLSRTTSPDLSRLASLCN